MRIGVLGAGFMGKTHAEAYMRMDGVEIAGILGGSDTKAQTLANALGVPLVTDTQQLFDDPSVEAVDICLPTPLHRPFVLSALQHGKHVLCEKPFALALDDCDVMIEAARSANRLLQVAHVVRFWPEYRRIHEIVASGSIGRPLFSAAYRLSTRPDWSTWIQDPSQTGGPIIDLMIHDFDVMNWLHGLPSAVQAAGVRTGRDGFDHALVSLVYRNCAATVEGGHLMPSSFPFRAGLRVICEEGTLEYSFEGGGTGVTDPGARNALRFYPVNGEARTIDVVQINPYDAECRYFVDCVEAVAAPGQLSAQAAREALAVSLAARAALYRADKVVLST